MSQPQPAMPQFPETLTLQAAQQYVEAMKKARGFKTDDSIYECFLLTEEVGELIKAVRKTAGWKIDPNSMEYSVADELADVLIFTLSLANMHNIDIEQALRDKEAKNNRRTWQEVK